MKTLAAGRKTGWALAATAAASAVVVSWFARGDLERPRGLGGRRLSIEEIRRVEVRGPAGRFVLERARAKDPWRLTRPFRAGADPALARALVRSLAELKGVRKFDEALAPRQLAEAGLHPPFATVRLFGAQGEEVEFRFGAVSVLPEWMFLEKEDGVWLVPSSFRRTLGLSRRELRDRRLVGVSEERVIGLSIREPKGETRLERRADGWWRLGPDATAKVDDRAARSLLALVCGPILSRYLDEKTAEPTAGGTFPVSRLELRTDTGARAGVVIEGDASGSESFGRLLGTREAVAIPKAVLFQVALLTATLRGDRRADPESPSATEPTASSLTTVRNPDSSRQEF